MRVFFYFQSCFDIFDEYVYCSDPTGCGLGNDALAWDYQACTQQTLPGGTTGQGDMFPGMHYYYLSDINRS